MDQPEISDEKTAKSESNESRFFRNFTMSGLLKAQNISNYFTYTLAVSLPFVFWLVVYNPTWIAVISLFFVFLLLFFTFVLVTLNVALLFKILLKSIFKILLLFRTIIQLNLKTTCDHHKLHHMTFPFFIHPLKPYSTTTCFVYLEDVLQFVLLKILTGCSILSSRVLLTAVKYENIILLTKREVHTNIKTKDTVNFMYTNVIERRLGVTKRLLKSDVFHKKTNKQEGKESWDKRKRILYRKLISF